MRTCDDEPITRGKKRQAKRRLLSPRDQRAANVTAQLNPKQVSNNHSKGDIIDLTKNQNRDCCMATWVTATRLFGISIVQLRLSTVPVLSTVCLGLQAIARAFNHMIT